MTEARETAQQARYMQSRGTSTTYGPPVQLGVTPRTEKQGIVPELCHDAPAPSQFFKKINSRPA